MPEAERFVGIAVSQAWLDVAERPSGQGWRVANDEAGWAELAARVGAGALVVVEASGGSEVGLVTALDLAGAPPVVANPVSARRVAQSLGRPGKTGRRPWTGCRASAPSPRRCWRSGCPSWAPARPSRRRPWSGWRRGRSRAAARLLRGADVHDPLRPQLRGALRAPASGGETAQGREGGLHAAPPGDPHGDAPRRPDLAANPRRPSSLPRPRPLTFNTVTPGLRTTDGNRWC
jgi:hypothetical protein